VFAGNDYLDALARRHGATPTVLPTTTDVPEGPAPKPPATPPLVLGWIGSSATLPYLEAQTVLLSAVVAAGRPFRLRIVADRSLRMPPGIAVDFVPFTVAGWRAALAGIHIGVAPLPDDAWTRGKCGLKVIQMMSVGRPVVASDVGVHPAIVRHGTTGLLAHTREAFLDALLTLIDDTDLRVRMGEAGLEHARTTWSVAAWTPRVVEAVDRWLA
jgi:glycosyltransferase involved in cell wall biosynthesis